MKQPFLWAHRGASGQYPENTMTAFEKALELNADGIELDVQYSKDRKIVVIHDETVNRTGNGAGGYIKDMTFEELRKINVGDAEKHTPVERIPLLEEVLELVKGSSVKLNIEFKTGIIEYEGLEEEVLHLVNGCKMADQVLYSSFNFMTIRQLLKIAPQAGAAYLFDDAMLDMPDYAAKTGVGYLHPSLRAVKEEALLQNARKKGLRLNVWTVDDPQEIRYCAEHGIDGIFTNHIERTRRTLHGEK